MNITWPCARETTNSEWVEATAMNWPPRSLWDRQTRSMNGDSDGRMSSKTMTADWAVSRPSVLLDALFTIIYIMRSEWAAGGSPRISLQEPNINIEAGFSAPPKAAAMSRSHWIRGLYGRSMKKLLLMALLAICAPTLADQAAVDKCEAAVTKKIRANEQAARRSSSESLTRAHHRLLNERTACRKKLKDPMKK